MVINIRQCATGDY